MIKRENFIAGPSTFIIIIIEFISLVHLHYLLKVYVSLHLSIWCSSSIHNFSLFYFYFYIAITTSLHEFNAFLIPIVILKTKGLLHLWRILDTQINHLKLIVLVYLLWLSHHLFMQNPMWLENLFFFLYIQSQLTGCQVLKMKIFDITKLKSLIFKSSELLKTYLK